MFFVQTSFSDKCDQPYINLLGVIDKRIAQISNYLLNNIRYGFDTKVDYETYENLTLYREILLDKIYCSDCLCDWSIDCIIAEIRKLTNQIC